MQPLRIKFEDENGEQIFGPIRTLRDFEIAVKIDFAKALSNSESGIKVISVFEGVKELLSITINCHVSTDYLFSIGRAIMATGSDQE